MNNFLKQKLLSSGLKRVNKQKVLQIINLLSYLRNFIFISGQLPFKNNKIFMEGKINQDLTKEDSKTSIFLATTKHVMEFE